METCSVPFDLKSSFSCLLNCSFRLLMTLLSISLSYRKLNSNVYAKYRVLRKIMEQLLTEMLLLTEMMNYTSFIKPEHALQRI